ncbi:MAG: hypothetical protein IJ935_02775 [Afipia sp.]|nr:hypothetical protein [Afipia sp.]
MRVLRERFPIGAYRALTHHRGQIHALLTGLGRPATELDLLFFQREQVKSASSR